MFCVTCCLAAISQEALVCSEADVDNFISKLYQWASSLTSNGRNMPLALPLRTDRSKDGFVVSI